MLADDYGKPVAQPCPKCGARYLVEKKGSYNVRRLLEAMATAESTDAAFRQALSLPYADFEQRLVADLERRVG